MGRNGNMVGAHKIPIKIRTVTAVIPTTMGPTTPLKTMLGKVPNMPFEDELELLELLELLEIDTGAMKGIETAAATAAKEL